MASRRRWHPDHYQTHPDPVGDPALYRESVQRVRSQWGPGVLRRPLRRESAHLVRAGEPLERDVAVVCTGCGMGMGLRCGAFVTPCPMCRSASYEVVS